jgi:hypothetical protein
LFYSKHFSQNESQTFESIMACTSFEIGSRKADNCFIRAYCVCFVGGTLFVGGGGGIGADEFDFVDESATRVVN